MPHIDDTGACLMPPFIPFSSDDLLGFFILESFISKAFASWPAQPPRLRTLSIISGVLMYYQGLGRIPYMYKNL